ncbi:NAD(P)-dependent oxidoreductase [Nostoc ellipsosporum NOK]|nr:NAD(P)-dependent oxidoreductase [Nostoc ellipsosporum NOK]
MKILVTGSSGHLGEAICRLLKEKNISYTGADLLPSAFTTHVGSIADRAFADELFRSGVDYVLHAATLHKPHVVTHSYHDFISTNITGTLNLLEACIAHKAKGFIYTSTTSTFGDMLTPAKGEPAAWITEETRAIPKNIYGVTKNAAEDLCQLFYRNHQLPCIVLKTSRFFPEEDDRKSIRDQYDDLNSKANEYLYRRVDIADAAEAHLLAIGKLASIGFAKYIISATSPFTPQHLQQLHTDAAAVVEKLFPEMKELYNARGWKMLPRIDRVYVNEKARTELGWMPRYDFAHILDCLKHNRDFRSDLALKTGSKGYHNETFANGPFPVTDDNI